MSEGGDEEKNEDPTDKKLREAREKGQVAHSREVNTWVILSTGAILIASSSLWLCNRLAEILREFLAQPHAVSMDGGALATLLTQSFGEIFGLLMVPLGILCIAAFLSGFMQTGPLLTTEPIIPKFEKLDPIKGAKRLFGPKSWVEFIKAFLKLSIVGTVTTIVLWPIYNDAIGMVGLEVTSIIDFLIEVAHRLFIAVCSVLFVFAAIDYTWQRIQMNKQLMMSKQEIRDEYKQSEGDPHIKARLRQLRLERARTRMMLKVPTADVVITNPTHFAVAMEYKQDKSGAPVVVAKGQDNIALKIREIAKENNVPIVENPPLARALFDTVELDQEIPEQHYKAVAEIISYVFSLKRR
jgi:flagellar biosynthetic protein FlhB